MHDPDVGVYAVLCNRRRLNTADSTESDPGPQLLASSSDSGRLSGPPSSGAYLQSARALDSSPQNGQKLEPRFLVIAGVKLGLVQGPSGRKKNAESSAGGIYRAVQAVAHLARRDRGSRGCEAVPSPVMRRYGSSESLATLRDGDTVLAPTQQEVSSGAGSRSLRPGSSSLGLRLSSDPLSISAPEHKEALMLDYGHATSLASDQVCLHAVHGNFLSLSINYCLLISHDRSPSRRMAAQHLLLPCCHL